MSGTVTLEYTRQLDLFDPMSFNTKIHVIGVGATGSHIVSCLADMGVQKIDVWDFDKIEPHNPQNSVYGREEVGMYKVDALQKIIERDTGIKIKTHREAVDGSQKLEGIVFLCTDSMKTRKEIWEKGLKYKPAILLVIETRMSIEGGQIHTVQPCMPRDIRGFEATLFDDSEAEAPACTNQMIGSTVRVVAGEASHKLVDFAKNRPNPPVTEIKKDEEKGDADAELILISPIISTARAWED